MCAHILADRGLLDLDAPVTTYWPEFGQAGKQDVPVRWLLSHRVGLPVVDDPPSLEEVLRWDPIVECLAAATPVWEPGTAHGYHALTYGWLVGEIVRRVSGHVDRRSSSPRTSPARSGLDFWIGLPAEEQPRVSPMIATVPGEGAMPDLSKLPPEILERLGDMANAAHEPRLADEPGAEPQRDFSLQGEMPWNTDEVRAAQIPAANGVTNARSLAKMYAATIGEVDGVRLLSDEAVKRACEEQSNGRDECLIVDTRFGLGFFLPSTFSPLAGPASFGHAGAGGSLGMADPELGIGYGYVMNKMSLGLVSGDPRTVDAHRRRQGLPLQAPLALAADPVAPSSSRRARKRSIWRCTASGPAPPRVVRRVTATPGARSSTAVSPSAGCARTRSARSAPLSSDSRTRAPTIAWASRNGVPCSTRCSARSVADDVGVSAAARMRSPSNSSVARSPATAPRASSTWSTASNSGSLSSCRSRL